MMVGVESKPEITFYLVEIFREDLFKQSLRQLKTEIVKANALAREANLITEELWSAHKSRRRGLAHYDVTLQIPATNLRPSKIKVCCSLFFT